MRNIIQEGLTWDVMYSSISRTNNSPLDCLNAKWFNSLPYSINHFTTTFNMTLIHCATTKNNQRHLLYRILYKDIPTLLTPTTVLTSIRLLHVLINLAWIIECMLIMTSLLSILSTSFYVCFSLFQHSPITIMPK